MTSSAVRPAPTQSRSDAALAVGLARQHPVAIVAIVLAALGGAAIVWCFFRSRREPGAARS